MSGKDVLERLREKLGGLKQYRYALLVAAVGVVLLLLPTGGEKKSQTASAVQEESWEETFSAEEMEQRLEATLSQVEGAGKVTVMLTVSAGSQRLLARDTTLRQDEDDREEERTTLVLSDDSGERTVTVQSVAPTFQGAVVVCPGGGDPAVCLTLTRAVSAVTGLGSDKITVCKGNT